MVKRSRNFFPKRTYIGIEYNEKKEKREKINKNLNCFTPCTRYTHFLSNFELGIDSKVHVGYLPVDGALVTDDCRGDVSLEPSVEPRLQNVDTVVEAVQPDHRAARRRSRERPPGAPPVHALVLGDVLRLLRVVDDPPHAAGKVHGHARPYRFLRMKHTRPRCSLTLFTARRSRTPDRSFLSSRRSTTHRCRSRTERNETKRNETRRMRI